MEGKILSIIDSSTAVVAVENKIKHPLYGKVLKRVKKFIAHVPTGKSLQKGDKVEITASKPISKRKKWILK